MSIFKKPLFHKNNQGILGFEITFSGYLFNESKYYDQLKKIRDKRGDLEYIIDEQQGNPSEYLKQKDVQILKDSLQKLIAEEKSITKEINDYYHSYDETAESDGDFNPYDHLYSDSRSLSYATTLVTDVSFLTPIPEEFSDPPPYLWFDIESFSASIKINFSEDIWVSISTRHVLYGECKFYGISICGGKGESYYDVNKFCEWVRMDGEVDYVDDDLGYWGTDQTICDGKPIFSLDYCNIGPGKVSFRLHSKINFNINQLSCDVHFHDDGNVNALIKVINGNELEERRETLGFIIVNRDATLKELENEIFTDESPSKAIALFRKLNGQDDNVIKAGNILLLTDPEHPCEEELAQLIAAQKTTQRALEAVEIEGIDRGFFLENYATLSNFFSIASTGIGIAGTVGEVYFNKINKILNQIDQLYKSTYIGNAILGGEAYYLRRGILFSQLDTLLKHSFLRQVLDLPQDKKIKSALRLSSKSIVHHWKKSGTRVIPGYATHIENASKLVKIMKTTGYVGIGFSALNSANEIYHACSLGRANECKQTTFREIGKFTGSMAGGTLGMRICLGFFPNVFATAGCVITLGTLIGIGGGYLGESISNNIYESFER
ncbi:hypothetical protein [Rosenbergiella epipactidis]|uniref:hypothetical protein n=1 Tax=Rosenbergiella epipactidis TaxID=1544694 RepID=UPI001F4EF45D|nr:hypothetical protein [Rosenbergiella epipactidis]